MGVADDLNERLENLRKDGGWQLRVCYSLRRPDKKDEASWQSYHADTLEAVVKRVEQEVRNRPVGPDTAPTRRAEAVEPKPADLPPGWVALAPVQVREGETRFGAEKLFPGDGKPVLQSSATVEGLARACQSYDEHRASSNDPLLAEQKPDPELSRLTDDIARRTSASRVSTGLSNTENTRY